MSRRESYRESLTATAQELIIGNGDRVRRLWEAALPGIPEGANQILAQVQNWAECALPTIEISHKLAASLASTTVSKTVASGLLPPWRTFAIHAPAGALDEVECFILCTHSPQKDWWLYTVTTSSLISGYVESLGDDLDDAEVKSAYVADSNTPDIFPAAPPSKDYAQRLMIVAQRLITGVILESINAGMGVHGKNQSLKLSAKRGLPVCNKFKLMRPVTIDVRKQVIDFLKHGKKSITVQTLVRGHYKMQPHGEARTQRKYIHVEPYWRGPEDAPIALRSHKMDLP